MPHDDLHAAGLVFQRHEQCRLGARLSDTLSAPMARREPTSSAKVSSITLVPLRRAVLAGAQQGTQVVQVAAEGREVGREALDRGQGL